jgi:NAD(P)-dependent dehydrogenase (short-subunit alcohol dehydrogenase family)
MAPIDKNRAVLITGCSSGIGRATADRLSRDGWTVYATARRPETIKDLADVGARLLALDVTDEQSMKDAVATVTDEAGAVSVLVNNAGYGLEGPFEETPMDEVRRQFETNVFGLVRLTQLVLPGMRAQRWGRIVNLSSMGGRMTLPGGAFYHGTKYAVEAMSDALRFEVRPFGIAVSLVEPGAVATAFGDTAVATVAATEPSSREPSDYAAFRALLAAKITDAYEGPGSKRASSPERIASVIEKAISARRPKPRYLVGMDARLLVRTKRMLPDRGFDAVLRSQFKVPAPSAPAAS